MKLSPLVASRHQKLVQESRYQGNYCHMYIHRTIKYLNEITGPRFSESLQVPQKCPPPKSRFERLIRSMYISFMKALNCSGVVSSRAVPINRNVHTSSMVDINDYHYLRHQHNCYIHENDLKGIHYGSHEKVSPKF